MKATTPFHIFPAWGFAVAQPLFDLMRRNGAFLSAHGLAWADLVELAALLSLLVPLTMFAIVLVVRHFNRAAANLIHCVVMGAMILLTCSGIIWRVPHVPQWFAIPLVILVSVSASYLYFKHEIARDFVTYLIPASLIFPALFLATQPMPGDPESRPVAPVQNASDGFPPIVLLVFDELPTTVLSDSQGVIDDKRFPNFAALAASAVWYRNATTVATHTASALAALVTGVRPGVGDRKVPPTAFRHPDNLFRLLGSSYTINAYEEVTQLCPVEICDRKILRGDVSVLADLAAIYLHVVAPPFLEHSLPPVDQGWAGFRFFRIGKQFTAAFSEGRREYVGQFLASIGTTADPTLHFLHTTLPHMPYQYLPTGNIFFRHSNPQGLKKVDGQERWTSGPLALSEVRQQLIWQTGYVDTVVGQVVQKLRELHMYDDALLIVTADHGVSIRAGEARRRLDRTNVRDILGVPLFVKFPGQNAGRIEKANVETVDVLPLLADVLDIQVPWSIDGRSPRSETDERPLKRTMDWSTERQFAASLMLTGSSADYEWPVLQSHLAQHLVGRPITDFALTIGPSADMSYPEIYGNVVPSVFVPCWVKGRLESTTSQDVAISVNGMIVAVTESYATEDAFEFSASFDEAAFRLGQNLVEVFTVEAGTGAHPRQPSLRPTLNRVFTSDRHDSR